MTRHTFLGDLASWAMAVGADETSIDSQLGKRALLIPSGEITFWSAATGGTQYTDLQDLLGNPISSVTADENGAFAPILGPDGPPDVWYMWADGNGGAGPRRIVVATDLADYIGAFSDDHTAFNDLLAFFRTGAVGQMLTPDTDPTSEFGIRWGTPPAGGGGSGAAGYVGVDVTLGPYSADKTGTVDARTVIQQAIDDVSASGGGVVLLPPGTYLISYPGLQLKSNVWLRGAGQEATLLQATGTWSSEAGILNIGTLSTAANVWRAHASHMWLKGTSGTAFATTPPSLIDGIVLNTGNVTWDSDAVHRFHDLLLWDFDRGMVVYGADDQAINFVGIRIRHTLRQGALIGHEDGSGGAADNNFLYLDVSSANRQTSGTYAGMEVYGSNCTFVGCGSWFNKRATAFAAGSTYKDGAGWYIAGSRNRFVACEAQDNGGHGWVLALGKSTYEGCVADSSNYLDNISDSAGQYECSGWYIGANASDVVITGAESYNRSSYSQLQKYGFVIDAATRNVLLNGTAWDNKSSGGSATPNDGVAWVNGTAHSSHEVRIQSAFGSTRTTIVNTSTAMSGTVARRKAGSDEVTVTGTILTPDNVLTASVPGGARYYRVEALIIYRADATDNARIGFATAVVAGSGTVDFHWQPHYTKADGTAQNPYVLSSVGTTRYIVADGDGGVTGSGYTNQRSVYVVGHMFVGTSVTTGSVTLQVATDTSTGGTGIRVKENSYLTVTPVTYS